MEGEWWLEILLREGETFLRGIPHFRGGLLSLSDIAEAVGTP